MSFKSAVFSLAAAALLLGTLGSGWLHGRLVQRWGQAEALQAAAAKLPGGLPQQLGDWRLAQTHELEEGVGEVLQCAAHLEGEYLNDLTGDRIVVAIVVGPAGPISVHNPEICYSAQDYEMNGDRQRLAMEDTNGQTHTLWQVEAHSRDGARPPLRLLYAWSRGSQWEAASGPRFAFAGYPVLYKLQLSGPPHNQPTDSSSDACQAFLSQFLAKIQPHLIATSRVAPHAL